jgi:serpin B
MMSGGKGQVREAGGWQAVELSYRDGTLAAVAVLPPEGTDPCDVDAATLAGLEKGPTDHTEIALPRMTIEQEHQLLDPLTALGLPVGPFPRLLPGRLDQVVQKTVLRVDERGTEAATPTGGAIAVSAPGRMVVFDRPFLFLLTDTATRSPLFTAVVRDPAER